MSAAAPSSHELAREARSFLDAHAAHGRRDRRADLVSWWRCQSLAPLESFACSESFVAGEVVPDGQVGLTSSIRHSGPPWASGVTAFTNAGASPPRIQMCESGGILWSSEAIAPAIPGTCTFTT